MKIATQWLVPTVLMSFFGACSSSSHGLAPGAGGAIGTGGSRAAGGSIGGSATGGAGGDKTGGICDGTPEYCLMYSTRSACESVGCYWDNTTPLEFCDGTASPCSHFTTSSSCAFAGCDWLAGVQPDSGSGPATGQGGTLGTGGASVAAGGGGASGIPGGSGGAGGRTGTGGTAGIGATGGSSTGGTSVSPGQGGSRAGGTSGADAAATGGMDGGGRVGEAGGISEVDGGGLADADSALCDGSAMDGTWYRSLDGLTMILASQGCSITGSANGVYYLHAIAGIYDSVARTMVGTITRTKISSGCTTIMNTTWVLTDPTHLTMIITGTDGACDLARTYSEQSVLVRQ